jgi:chromosome segregation ATPase
MPNVQMANGREIHLETAYEQELKEKLHSTLVSKAEINDLCEKLQIRDSERERQYSKVKPLIKDLCDCNDSLQSFAKRAKKEYASLKKEYESLKDKYISLKTRYNELEAELQEVNSSFAYINDTLSEGVKKSKDFILEFQSFFDANEVEDEQEAYHKTSGGQVDQKITIP